MHKNKSHSFLFNFFFFSETIVERLIVNYFNTNLRKEIKLPNGENDKNKLCQQLFVLNLSI